MYREEQLKSLLQDRRILIAGYGREGKSSERLIRQLLPDADIAIVEGNDNIRREAARGYDLIIKSPGIPTFVLEDCCDLNTVTSQTDLFLQVYHDQTVGITGTKGKSTTTNVTAALLRRRYPDTIMAGNMGIPLFDIIPQIGEGVPIVCEFSCHQLENIKRAPHVGVVLNLYQEHLDHYHSYMDYQMAKLQVALKQGKDDHFIYGTGSVDLDDRIREHQFANRPVPVGLEDIDEVVRMQPLLQGNHNMVNMTIAMRIARIYGVEEQDIHEVIHTFSGLEHRLELVGTYHGITFYNDSISTIPEACIAACKALKQVDTLILGGFDRGIEYGTLSDYLGEAGIRNLVFVGEAGRRIREGYKGDANILMENDYARIVPWCFEHTAQGKICLMSPAAASYDAFRNFEERGSIFKDMVRKF